MSDKKFNLFDGDLMTGLLDSITGSNNVIQEVKLVEKNSIQELEEAINLHLSEGYVMYDKMTISAWQIGPGVVKRTFVQTLIKYTKKSIGTITGERL
jgi:hypothetical protein